MQLFLKLYFNGKTNKKFWIAGFFLPAINATVFRAEILEKNRWFWEKRCVHKIISVFKNLSSYFDLINARMSASDKEQPIDRKSSIVK